MEIGFGKASQAEGWSKKVQTPCPPLDKKDLPGHRKDSDFCKMNEQYGTVFPFTVVCFSYCLKFH